MKKTILKFTQYILVLLPVFSFSYEKGISVVIPCYYKHFDELNELLDAYASQTQRPDEVVISLSEANKVDTKEIEKLRNSSWPFLVQLIQSSNRYFAGENRNIGVGNAKYELVILQDADDLPHPQRVEIISMLFDTYDFDHLIHFFNMSTEETSQQRTWKLYDRKYVLKKAVFMGNYDSLYSQRWRRKNSLPHNGNIAIKRSIFEDVSWTGIREGEDEQFNRKIYATSNKCLFVRLPLVNYRYYKTSEEDRKIP